MLLQNGNTWAFTGLRYYGSSGAAVGNFPGIAPSNFIRPGAFRNIFAGEAGINPKSSIPAGARHPVAWQMPQKAGGLASRNETKVLFSHTANMVLGLPSSGTATITLDVPDATGGLIVSSSGSASISLSITGTILSIASASGSATITFAPAALIGAQAGIQGTANINVTSAATIKGIGYMSGISTNETEFSESALARAVWTALATDYNTAGSMGEKLNDAGSAGDPWATAVGDADTPGTMGEFVQKKILLTSKFLALK